MATPSGLDRRGVVGGVTMAGVAMAGMAMAGPALGVAAGGGETPGSGLRDFDFQVGRWTVRHRVKRPDPAAPWLEFEGTCENRPLMDGAGNVEDHVFHRATGDTRAMGFRAYDAETRLWAIWWVDGRAPHAALDPPVKGRFEHGVGAFFSDGEINGQPARTRYLWSNITPGSARWEQAVSLDGGRTWDTNWTMEFRRV